DQRIMQRVSSEVLEIVMGRVGGRAGWAGGAGQAGKGGGGRQGAWRTEDMGIRGEASASVRAGGAPAPVKESRRACILERVWRSARRLCWWSSSGRRARARTAGRGR